MCKLCFRVLDNGDSCGRCEYKVGLLRQPHLYILCRQVRFRLVGCNTFSHLFALSETVLKSPKSIGRKHDLHGPRDVHEQMSDAFVLRPWVRMSQVLENPYLSNPADVPHNDMSAVASWATPFESQFLRTRLIHHDFCEGKSYERRRVFAADLGGRRTKLKIS